MDPQLYSNLVQCWAEHLSGEENVEFEKFLVLGKSNRRVRNLSGFLALTSDNTFNKFTHMSKRDSSVSNLRFNLAKALTRLEREPDTEVSNFTKSLKSKYFAHMKPLVNDKYDVSAEMAKLYLTMVNSYSLANKHHNEEFQNRVNNTMEKFNLSVLN